MARSFIDADIVKVRSAPDSHSDVVATLFWGDEIFNPKPNASYTRVDVGGGRLGYIKGRPAFRSDPILRIVYIDVGQGDAALIETMDDKRILIDAGEEKFLARYIATKFARTGSVHFDAIVITHGDADHYLGLPILVDAASHPTKKIHVTAERIFHNGLFKRAGKNAVGDGFGRAVQTRDYRLITDLLDDPRDVPTTQRTRPLSRWIQALDALEQRRKKKLVVRRLDATSASPFSFLTGVGLQVLGPVLRRVGRHEGLPFLHGEGGGGMSVSHTINGHSIVLRLVHGDVRFLFSGDLNAEAEQEMLNQVQPQELAAELFKVPHHGSADFGDAFLKTVSPIVSVVSTGATDNRKDYLHPRANLVAALGAASRVPVIEPGTKAAEPIVFVTKMAGNLQYMGWAVQLDTKKDGTLLKDASGKVIIAKGAEPFYALERGNYGIVHVRSDGKRFLVARHGSGQEKKEAYAYRSLGNSRFVAAKVRTL